MLTSATLYFYGPTGFLSRAVFDTEGWLGRRVLKLQHSTLTAHSSYSLPGLCFRSLHLAMWPEKTLGRQQLHRRCSFGVSILYTIVHFLWTTSLQATYVLTTVELPCRVRPEWKDLCCDFSRVVLFPQILPASATVSHRQTNIGKKSARAI